MMHGAVTAIRLALRFSDRALARPMLNKLGARATLRIVRARITSAEAWFEVELAGSVREVQQALKISRPNKEKSYAP